MHKYAEHYSTKEMADQLKVKKERHNMEEIQTPVAEATENTETQTVEEKVEKTFTQAEFITALEKEVARKTRNLPSKEELNEFKQWKEAQKTEAEKAQEIQKQIETLTRENLELKNERVVANAGIDPKFIKFVVSEVSQMNGEFEDNLNAYIEANPQFKIQPKEEKPITQTTGFSQKTSIHKSAEKAYLDEKYKNNPYYKG